MNVSGIGPNILYGYLGSYGQKSTDQISQEVAATITRFDANGDGALSAEESGLAAGSFSQADSDGDGSLTEKELLDMMQGFQSGGPLFNKSIKDLSANIIAENDADGDGALSLAESEIQEEQFIAADADGDGLLTKEELVDMMQSFQPGGPLFNKSIEDKAANIIAENDADGDGALSLAESEGHEEQFIAADADGDGLVTQEELVAMIGAESPMGPPSTEEDAARRIATQDADGDGVISSSESGLPDEIFDAIDTNKDGVISQAELEAALTTIQKALDDSGLGRGPEAIEAAGGLEAYREKMYQIILKALTGGDAGGEVDTDDPITAGPYQVGKDDPITVGPYPADPDDDITVGPYPADPDDDIEVGPYPADPDDDIEVGPYPADPDDDIEVGPYPADPDDGIEVGPFPADPDDDIAVGPYQVDPDGDAGAADTGMVAYQQEMDKNILSALFKGNLEGTSLGALYESGQTGYFSVTA